MLSVVEQRAGMWGALAASTSAAAAQQVVTSDDQHGLSNVDGNLSGDQPPLANSPSYDLPSVRNRVCL